MPFLLTRLLNNYISINSKLLPLIYHDKSYFLNEGFVNFFFFIGYGFFLIFHFTFFAIKKLAKNPSVKLEIIIMNKCKNVVLIW